VAKKKTTNNTILVATLLFFLIGFFVSNVNLTGNLSYTGVRGCAYGDVNRDDKIATENDFERLEKAIRGSVGITECADVNRDGVVNDADMDALFLIASQLNEERNTRGRYCFDECSQGEIVCIAEHKLSVQERRVIAKGSRANIYKTCGNYDSDPCLELSPESYSCGTGTKCQIKNPGSDICLNLNLAEENIINSRTSPY
jgi:hypothetical protein